MSFLIIVLPIVFFFSDSERAMFKARFLLLIPTALPPFFAGILQNKNGLVFGHFFLILSGRRLSVARVVDSCCSICIGPSGPA